MDAEGVCRGCYYALMKQAGDHRSLIATLMATQLLEDLRDLSFRHIEYPSLEWLRKQSRSYEFRMLGDGACAKADARELRRVVKVLWRTPRQGLGGWVLRPPEELVLGLLFISSPSIPPNQN